MRKFSTNLHGRVRNFCLPKNKPLIPLFEAIVNSIHAIYERKAVDNRFDPQIIIKIIRDDSQCMIDGVDELPPIKSFEIIDNGIGFTENNMKSFMESDSTYKAELGGKGVGRFSWLVAFEKAEIESCFSSQHKMVKRSFDFWLENPEIDDTAEEVNEETENKTSVKLLNCKYPYAENIPKKATTIAMKIIQHCLEYFIAEDCPKINIYDDYNSCSLNHIFTEKFQTESNTKYIKIGNETFELMHVKSEENSIEGNKLYLCAHNRLVETKELDKLIVDLDRKFYSKSGFWYVGVVRSTYLDKNVDMNRLSFNIPESGSDLLENISMENILSSVVGEIKDYLSEYLQPISDSKLKSIRNFIADKAPQYRYLLKYMTDEIANIKPNLSDDKLDDELHRLKRKFECQIKESNSELFEMLNKGVINSEEYEQHLRLQIEKINSANSSALADYVAHRKVILDLMEYAIKRQDDGKFMKESFLHNLIYPTKTTSDDLPYSNHNLWLIDEKLAYCNYISSDIPFNNDHKQDRTDIMLLNSPVAISEEENNGTEYDSIVIFELKRPMRNDYSIGDNPVSQLYKYVTQLKTNRLSDKYGRIIHVGINTRFYLYAICDITPSLMDTLDFYNFSQMSDKVGYYCFNDKMNSYIEILPYNKIINDANKRNRILFEKLGI